MKQFSLLIAALTIVVGAFAQTTFESPHVTDGKTLQLTIPEGYYTVDSQDELGVSMYSTAENLDVDINNIESLDVGLLFLMHMPSDGETLNSLTEQLEEKMEEDKSLTIVQAPKIVDINGRDCMTAGFKGNFMDDLDGATYFGIIEFGDYFILLTYFGSESLKEHMSFNKFKEVVSSWKEVETTKTDQLEAAMEEEYAAYADEEEYEDYSIYFPNDLFETKFDYYDVLPDFDDGWNDYIDESGHLLSMFSYKDNNGFVKVFSGGSASNYPSEEEMATAIKSAMDWKKSITLTFDSKFSNEDHVFKLYSISGGGSMSSVYTAEVAEEMIFFVVDGGSDPVEGFKPAVRDFMLTMWIDDFFEEGEE